MWKGMTLKDVSCAMTKSNGEKSYVCLGNTVWRTDPRAEESSLLEQWKRPAIITGGSEGGWN